ncbi:MAG TPA: undecaprenyldiphospho-muramoylpentapeptide beta-N-acetylglucosaminyltransferase [Ruminiclostridium sp.]|nr:undecaprenyldiphospho-muramoylpentapeptide beta-N-acetylglucosaminyltransferase [Ruminiclostridium sp.]
MKTIVMTGGGTAGHITPNIALIPKLRGAGFNIHYIGLKNGMEEALIKEQGVEFHGIKGGKLRRYFDIKNFTDVFKIGAGFFESVSLIKKIKPDIVFSKGGFVSTPVVWAASFCHVPVVAHESDGSIGLANKLSLPFTKKVCYTFPETGSQIPEGKGIFTGLPIRDALLKGSAEIGREICGFSGEKPVIVVTGGSQGAQFINELLRDCLAELLPEFFVCHICGKGNLNSNLEGVDGYRQFEYVTDDLKHLFAMADIVISRAGATSIFELLALKKPNLLIPYGLAASRGDQILNARSFQKQGFSEVLNQNDATKEKFLSMIKSIYENRSFYIEKMEKSAVKNGLESVFSIICETAGV